jgi:hypothetical protein
VFLTTRNLTPFLTVPVYRAHHAPQLRTKAIALLIQPLLDFERLHALRHTVSPMRQVVPCIALIRLLGAVVLLLASFGLAISEPVIEHFTKGGIDWVCFADPLT